MTNATYRLRILGLLLGLCAVVVTAFAATPVPNTFVNDTVADANQVNANFTHVVDAINETIAIRTRLTYNNGIQDTTVSGTFELLRTVGDFTKVFANTDIILVWNSHGQGTGTFCNFQLRIDGLSDDFDDGRAVFTPIVVTGGIRNTPFSVMAEFTGLTAGIHTVSVWVRGIASDCWENPGNYPRSVFIEETL